jgi:hypothetical protein
VDNGTGGLWICYEDDEDEDADEAAGAGVLVPLSVDDEVLSDLSGVLVAGVLVEGSVGLPRESVR